MLSRDQHQMPPPMTTTCIYCVVRCGEGATNFPAFGGLLAHDSSTAPNCWGHLSQQSELKLPPTPRRVPPHK